jgi:hypothetical protein
MVEPGWGSDDPAESRAWVRDCRVRHLTRRIGDGPSERLPWTAAEYGEIEDDTNAVLAELGLLHAPDASRPDPRGEVRAARPPARRPAATSVVQVHGGTLDAGRRHPQVGEGGERDRDDGGGEEPPWEAVHDAGGAGEPSRGAGHR